MNIVTQSNEKYIPGLRMLLFSLRYNNHEEDIHVYLLDTEFSHYDVLNEDIEKLNIVRHDTYVPEEYIELIKTYQKNEKSIHDFSYLAAYRLFMPWILSDVHRILYLDSDILINGNISDFYNTDLGSHIGAVCEDVFQMQVHKFENKYFNSGMMLIDLDNFRKNISITEMKYFMEYCSNNFSFDQDILNVAMGKNVIWSSCIYNYHLPLDDWFSELYDVPYTDAVIYHMTANKPWVGLSYACDKAKQSIWSRYVKLYEEYFKCLNIITQSDEKCMTCLSTLMYSLRKNHKDARIKMYLMCADSEEAKKYDDVIKESSLYDIQVYLLYLPKDLLKVIKKNMSKESKNLYSVLSAYRIFIPWILPDVYRILYLDADTVVDGNIYPLYNMDIQGYVNGCKENPSMNFINSGMLLMDLGKIRFNIPNIEDVYKIMKEKSKSLFFDQEVINELYKDGITVIDSKWNCTLAKDTPTFCNKYKELIRARIYHFISTKPWIEYDKESSIKNNIWIRLEREHLTYLDSLTD